MTSAFTTDLTLALQLCPSVTRLHAQHQGCILGFLQLWPVLRPLLTCEAIWPWGDHPLIDLVLLPILVHVMNCPLQRRAQVLRNCRHARALRGRGSQLGLGWRAHSGLHISKGERRAHSGRGVVRGRAAAGVWLPGGERAHAPHGRGGRGALRVRGARALHGQRAARVVGRHGPLLSHARRAVAAAQGRPQRPPRRGHAGAHHVGGGLSSGGHRAHPAHHAVGSAVRRRLWEIKNIQEFYRLGHTVDIAVL